MSTFSPTLFETALRKRYRYNYKGVISTEDLFSLPKESLNSIYVALHEELQKENGVSLIQKKSTLAIELGNKIKIVAYIFEEKERKEQEEQDRIQKREQNAKVIAALELKREQELLNKSEEELLAMLKAK